VPPPGSTRTDGWKRLDGLEPAPAQAALERCCGSRSWVELMLARRPFGSREALLRSAREVWFDLQPGDWLEAFSAHPRIGDVEGLRRKFAATRELSEREQAGVSTASDAVLTALAEGNRSYEARFGFIFIVCATGRTADEMLALLRQRLGNDRATELRIAAGEQAKITAIRLDALAE
jgi:2-oxo-4-hydroxy-4-carboxy-5-ureidoimidazoline decarboxylase